jgi:hypothetical protein
MRSWSGECPEIALRLWQVIFSEFRRSDPTHLRALSYLNPEAILPMSASRGRVIDFSGCSRARGRRRL